MKKMTTEEAKLQQLKDYIRDLKKVCIAFSGGVDSTFLLKVAKEVLDNNVFAVTVDSIFFPKSELKYCKYFLSQNRIEHQVLSVDVTQFNEIRSNSTERCYFCKKNIFKSITELALNNGIKYVLDGSNIDDVQDFRPGAKALKELKIISPLKMFNMTKKEIRYFSKMMGLATWKKASFACLASRIPYDHPITKENIAMVEKAEEVLKSLELKQYRVRHHGDVARIEVLPEDKKIIIEGNNADLIYNKFKEIGFKFTAVDIRGYKMGNMNEHKEV